MNRTTLIVFVILVALKWVAADSPEAALGRISTIPADQAKALNKYWVDSPNIGMFVIGDEIGKLAAEFQKLHASGGADAVAKRLLASYETDAATPEMAAAALAMLAEAGYGAKRNKLDKNLFKSKKEDEKKLLQAVSEIMTKLAATNRLAAIEFLLQVHCEGLVCLHNMSGNGGRRPPLMPHSVTALAAPFLEDADPFVQALADWTISVTVCNSNDQKGGKAFKPDARSPEWFARYMAVPALKHLPFDYVRQAATLGMHRRASDLIKLAEDVTRRAKARAAWVKENGGNPATAVAALDTALAKLKGSGDSPTLHKAWLAWRMAARDAVLQGPDLDFKSLVYITRFNAKSHLQPGVHSASQFPDGGNIHVQTGLNPDAAQKGLVADKLKKGFGHDLDLWWDADRIVFAWKKGGVQKLFEIGLDGKGLKQVTDGPFDDVDPAYLPDGEVVFGSTRGNVGIMCHGSSGLGGVGRNGESGTFSGLHTNIYRTRNAFKGVERLSYCKDDDAYPHVLNDGRVVFMRWDYQERDVNEIFSLWVMYPDGSGADGFHRVHIPAKATVQALRDTRPVEDSDLMVSAGGGHYSYAEGIVVLGDPRAGINNPDSLQNVTPFASPVTYGWGKMKPVPEGGVPYVGGYYCKPWALSEKSFLVSASYDQPVSNNFQAYYIDVWGNKELVYRDKVYETVCVTPVKKRKRPPILADRTNNDLAHATLYMENVYADLPGVKEGDVKYVRILQMIHWIKRLGQGGIQWHPKANASECFAFGGTGGAVRTVGLVPVEADGSAYFEVPADADLYFQALDKNFMAVRRMRTHVEFQPGENRGCIGCHETKSLVVAPARNALALKKPAVRPMPPPWGDTTLLSYEKHIQPLFDKKCAKCHDGSKSWLDLTSRRDQFGFMQGYRALFGLKASDTTPHVDWTVTGAINPRNVKLPRSHKHPWWDIMFKDIYVRGGTGGKVTEVNQFGAVKHPLAQKLVKHEKHRKILTKEELQLIMNFFDVQAPYFSTFRQKKRKDLIQVDVIPYKPFEKSREHDIKYGKDVTPKL